MTDPDPKDLAHRQREAHEQGVLRRAGWRMLSDGRWCSPAGRVCEFGAAAVEQHCNGRGDPLSLRRDERWQSRRSRA